MPEIGPPHTHTHTSHGHQCVSGETRPETGIEATNPIPPQPPPESLSKCKLSQSKYSGHKHKHVCARSLPNQLQNKQIIADAGIPVSSPAWAARLFQNTPNSLTLLSEPVRFFGKRINLPPEEIHFWQVPAAAAAASLRLSDYCHFFRLIGRAKLELEDALRSDFKGESVIFAPDKLENIWAVSTVVEAVDWKIDFFFDFLRVLWIG